MVHCSTGSDSGSGNGRGDKLCVSVYRAIVKSSPEIVRSSLLPFFTFAADDFAHTVSNLKTGRFSHVKGTITRGIRFRSGVGTKSTLRPFTGARRGQKGRNSKPEWLSRCLRVLGEGAYRPTPPAREFAEALCAFPMRSGAPADKNFGAFGFLR